MKRDQMEREVAKGLLRWYEFPRKSKILYIGQEDDPLAEFLKELELPVTLAAGSSKLISGAYDFIIAIASLEKEKDPVGTLKVWKSLLKENGKLLLGMNNRLGLKYFCGEAEPYSHKSFKGIEAYRGKQLRRGENFSGRCYDKKEIETMLQKSGFLYTKLYAVLPDLAHPQLIYGEPYLPNEELASRLFPMYHEPWKIFMEEEGIYSGLIQNGLFYAMANAFFIECALDESFLGVKHVTFTSERSPQDSTMTVVLDNGTVEKRAMYREGIARLKEIEQNHRELQRRGVKCVDTRLIENRLCMPYLEGKTAQVYLSELVKNDLPAFFKEFDRFRDLIMLSSEISREEEEDGLILKKGYLDMIPLNCIYENGEFVFIDQEFCVEDCPLNMLLNRTIRSFYYGNEELMKALPFKTLCDRYGLSENAKHWDKLEDDFLADLRNEKDLKNYHLRYRRDPQKVEQNRERIERIAPCLWNIFDNVGERKLIVFGSGKYADQFIALFRREYDVHAVVDNNSEKWGGEMYGIPIQSPEMLADMDEKIYKIFICMKDWYPVAAQLEGLGIRDYGVYNPSCDYPRNRRLKHGAADASQRKKYHVGYVAGVFDLFHKGHLNLIRRAKEQCEYLIVGVVNDERVKWIKGKPPFIPFEERLEIVASCRYVDEAVEIPTVYGDSHDAYAVYHFDCQFSGNDHINDLHWLKEQQYLREHGSDLVFFPYTEGTSSTMLKALIQENINKQS